CYGGIAAKVPLLVANGGNDVVAAKPCAVLAQVPALFLEPASPGGDGEFAFQRLLAVGHIENPEVTSDDLLGVISVDGLSAGTPAADAAVIVQHVDRAVLDRVNDEASSRLTLPELLFDVVAT